MSSFQLTQLNHVHLTLPHRRAAIPFAPPATPQNGCADPWVSMNAKSIALNEQALSVKTQVRHDPTQLYGMPDRVGITVFPLVARDDDAFSALTRRVLIVLSGT
jgi:hypothetical protein